jgi:hypothetical protein
MVSLLDGRQDHLFNYQLVAKSLNAARREAAQRTADSIAGLERDGVLNENDEGKALLSRALRGIPSIGRGSSGVISDSCVAGSDEHLDQMCR